MSKNEIWNYRNSEFSWWKIKFWYNVLGCLKHVLEVFYGRYPSQKCLGSIHKKIWSFIIFRFSHLEFIILLDSASFGAGVPRAVIFNTCQLHLNGSIAGWNFAEAFGIPKHSIISCGKNDSLLAGCMVVVLICASGLFFQWCAQTAQCLVVWDPSSSVNL